MRTLRNEATGRAVGTRSLEGQPRASGCWVRSFWTRNPSVSDATTPGARSRLRYGGGTRHMSVWASDSSAVGDERPSEFGLYTVRFARVPRGAAASGVVPGDWDGRHQRPRSSQPHGCARSYRAWGTRQSARHTRSVALCPPRCARPATAGRARVCRCCVRAGSGTHLTGLAGREQVTT